MGGWVGGVGGGSAGRGRGVAVQNRNSLLQHLCSSRSGPDGSQLAQPPASHVNNFGGNRWDDTQAMLLTNPPHRRRQWVRWEVLRSCRHQ